MDITSARGNRFTVDGTALVYPEDKYLKNCFENNSNGAETVDWLRGIKTATVRYLLRRGAFVDAVKALFPEVAWEDDARDDAA